MTGDLILSILLMIFLIISIPLALGGIYDEFKHKELTFQSLVLSGLALIGMSFALKIFFQSSWPQISALLL